MKPILMSLLVLLSACAVSPPGSERGDDIKFTPQQLALPGKRGGSQTLRDPAKSQVGTWVDNLPKLAQVQPYWNYSWGADWIPQQTKYMNSEFVPMIWGKPKSAEDLRKTFQAKVVPRIKDGTIKRLLGFNEPDKVDQSNIPFMDAIELWPEFMKLRIPLCSPACANPVGINDESVQGVPGTWMRDFMKEADRRGYRVDYIGAHWYGGTSVESFKVRMRLTYEKYGRRPLLITEFAPADWQVGGDIKKNRHTPAAVLKFMKEVLPWMEEQDWIAGYNWFSFNITSPQGTSSALLDEAGNLTACGRYYRSVTRENPKGDQTIEPDPFWPDTQRSANLKFTPQQLALPGKRGACFTLREPVAGRVGTRDHNLPKLAKLQPYWNYSWGADWVAQQTNVITSEFMPMIWGKPESAEALRKTFQEKVVPRIKADTVKRVLGFNEPDKVRQADMPYMAAIELWPVFMELGVPLGSPSCANPVGIEDDSTQGVPGTWMRDFMREVGKRGYRVDYIGAHWYGGTRVADFKKRLRLVYEKNGRRPLLITEFAPADWKTGGDIKKHRLTPAAVLQFMKEALPWMEAQDWIAGYAWFSFKIDSPVGTSSALFDEAGNLTACGRYYRSVTRENPKGDQSIEPDRVRE